MVWKSRKQWSEKTINNPLMCSKTVWPVPVIESMFLPEFKIKNDMSEDTFVLLENVSAGTFGKVYKVMKKDSKEIYAMKVLSKFQIMASSLVNQMKDEVKIQQLVGHHPFIVNCSFFWQSKKKLYLISEYISGGELLKVLQDNGPLHIKTITIYLSEIALVLDFLHNAGIIYRDLKLENILLNNRKHIQIIDFGLSKWLKYGSRTNTVCGTLEYIAPEVLQRQPYGHAADWWSLGIIFICMLTGQMMSLGPTAVDGVLPLSIFILIVRKGWQNIIGFLTVGTITIYTGFVLAYERITTILVGFWE